MHFCCKYMQNSFPSIKIILSRWLSFMIQFRIITGYYLVVVVWKVLEVMPGIGAGSDLLISLMETLNLFQLIGLITLVLLMRNWIGLFLNENHLIRSWDHLSLPNCVEAITLPFLLKLPQRRLESLYFILSSKVALYLHKSNIQNCMEYCYCV